MKRILGDLDLHLLNTLQPAGREVELVESAFWFWHKSWTETFKSVNAEMKYGLRSDDFLYREPIALFDGPRPVALFFSATYEMRPSQMYHSYFSNYPQPVLHKMREMGATRFMTLSYMTCDPEYRKSNTDVPMTELLFSLGVLKFQTLPHEFMLGYIRTDLSFHKVFENHGGVKIGSSETYSRGSDYLYMTKETMRLSSVPGVAETAMKLWTKSRPQKDSLRWLESSAI